MDEEKVMKQCEILSAKIFKAIQEFEKNSSSELRSLDASKRMYDPTPVYNGDPVADFRFEISGPFLHSSVIFECIVDEGILRTLDLKDRTLESGGLKPGL